MDKLFLDINVVLDVAVSREPYFAASQQILDVIYNKKAVGYFSAISFPTLFYLVKREKGAREALSYIRDLMKLLLVVEANQKVLQRSLEFENADFEDSIQMACAEACHADYLITRNIPDFKNSPVSPILPATYLAPLNL